MTGILRRDRLSIRMDILKAVRDHDQPTRIMYAANVSWTQLENLLGDMVRRGIVQTDLLPSGRHKYRLTMEAHKLIDDYSKVMDRVEPSLQRLVYA